MKKYILAVTAVSLLSVGSNPVTADTPNAMGHAKSTTRGASSVNAGVAPPTSTAGTLLAAAQPCTGWCYVKGPDGKMMTLYVGGESQGWGRSSAVDSRQR